jgi:hypothetical protein
MLSSREFRAEWVADQAHALEWLAALELRVKALEQVREAGARSATRTAGLQA